ncbi:MAG: DUF5103 domain-containing protein [Bacteroidales bacterium]
MKKTVILTTTLFICCFSFSQQADEYFEKEFIRNQDHAYRDYITSVRLYKTSWELSQPILELHSGETLTLEFDDLQSDVKAYKMTLVHCDALWRPSDLDKSEYLDGFWDDDINDYSFSYNTTKGFTHYVAEIPSDYLRFTKSGNYILRIFTGEDEDQNVVLTRRLMVTDPKVRIEGEVGRPLNVSERESKQAVDFMVKTGNYYIRDPFEDLVVIIRQNGRWDNAKSVEPRSSGGSGLDYRYIRENAFNGGNEFRQFDMKNLKYQSERIRRIEYGPEGYQVYLWPDERRIFKPYVYKEDLNGKRSIESENSRDNSVESDYAYVHFTLPYDFPLVNGNLYILGALTDWQFTEEGMMKYDYEDHTYKTSLYLKEGYYNYMYVFFEDDADQGDMTLIEGNHFETENDYSVYVYHRQQGTKYDQLIGIAFFNSLIKK